MFEPLDILQKPVEIGNVEESRTALSTYLSKNPTNQDNEITDARDYAERKLGVSLWEKYDNRIMEKDQTKWSKEYLAELMSDLRHNFAKERFLHIMEVGRVVRKKKPKENPTGRAQQQQTNPKAEVRQAQSQQSDNFQKWIIPVAIIGIAAVVYFMVKK